MLMEQWWRRPHDDVPSDIQRLREQARELDEERAARHEAEFWENERTELRRYIMEKFGVKPCA